MKKLLICGLASVTMCAASLALAAGVAVAQERTTAPGYNFKINVYITPGGVRLDRSVVKRGWLAHFVIHNATSKPVVFEVGGLKTSSPIKPGKIGKIGAFCDTRGQFKYFVNHILRGFFQVV
jgi:hypothetical protein